MISSFAVRLPISWAARLNCHSFASSIQFFNYSSIQGDLADFTVIFWMGTCLLVFGISSFINVSSAASGCSSLHTTHQQILFTSSTYESLQNFLYALLYTILGPAFETLVFLLRLPHPMDLDTALKQIFAVLVKMWSIHVDDLILDLTDNLYRLHKLVTVWSFFLSGQLDESQSIF